jgi:hypothetical protein
LNPSLNILQKKKKDLLDYIYKVSGKKFAPKGAQFTFPQLLTFPNVNSSHYSFFLGITKKITHSNSTQVHQILEDGYYKTQVFSLLVTTRSFNSFSQDIDETI